MMPDLSLPTTTQPSAHLSAQLSAAARALAQAIAEQRTVTDLARVSAGVKLLLQDLARCAVSACRSGQLITSLSDAVTTRLIELAEQQFGPAPIGYVWVAAGSQARQEQSAQSDQDNCLILPDSYRAATQAAYFRDFSKFVCDGLNDCGYLHCPGNVMAMNDTWCQPRRRWLTYFRQWIDQPSPKALMLACVFFDLRTIHGDAELLESLRCEVLASTRDNSLFLAYMVSNALKHRPPLKLFGRISLIRDGEHANTLDLKHSGLVPIVDLARIYALAGGLTAVSTQQRLEQAAQTHEVSVSGARDLGQAFEFMGRLRQSQQARQLAQGQTPDSFLALGALSKSERSQLKDAFLLIQTLQDTLGQRYQAENFGA